MVAAALGAALGAWAAVPIPLAVAAAFVALALSQRRGWMIVLAVGLLTSALAARAWRGLSPPQLSSFQGVVVVVADPEIVHGVLQTVVSAQGRRLEVSARGELAWQLRDRQVGDHVQVAGTISPLGMSQRRRLGWKHIAGRLTIAEVLRTQPGAPPWVAANAVRGLLARGSVSLPKGQRALLAGLVLGDDREQPAALRDAFRASGLTHLLAVSGQNVAFVLAVAGPLLQRCNGRIRWVLTIAVLALFAVVTRFEPSVIRATLMAGLAATATARGRPTSGLRILSLATVLSLVLDPLLIGRAGFQLSVLATAGILIASPAIARKLRGPKALRLSLSVTLAAQLATAPLLVSLFGGVPLVAVPANLLAEPAAGAAMTYGLAGGLVAGLLGGRLAWLIHLPTRVLLWWIEEVARRSAQAPLGQLHGAQLAVLGVIGLILLTRRYWWPAVLAWFAV